MPKVKYMLGERLAVDVAKENGISVMAFRDRLLHGWNIEEAATKPPRNKVRKEHYEYPHDFFTKNLYDNIKAVFDKQENDYEKIITIEVFRACIRKRWDLEKDCDLTHQEFRQIRNYLDNLEKKMDIPEEEVEGILRANQTLVDIRVSKLFYQFFGTHELEKAELCQKN